MKIGRPLRIALAVVVASMVLYSLAGFALLPYWLKTFLPEVIEKEIGRKASVEKIRINPFTLIANFEGFRLYEADGKGEAMRVEHLHANASIASLFKGAIVIDELRIEQPLLHVARTAPQRFSFSDIIDRILAKPPSEPTHFSVNNVQLSKGRIDFDDRVTHSRHQIDAIRIDLPFLSDLPHDVQIFVAPYLSARVNGSPIEIKGKSKPFSDTLETSADLEIKSLDLPHYLGFSPVPLRFKLASGTADGILHFAFRRPSGAPPTLRLSGSLQVTDLRMTDLADQPALAWKRLELELKQIDLPDTHIVLERVLVEAPEIHAVRNDQGTFNFQDFLPESGSTQSDTNQATGKAGSSQIQAQARAHPRVDINRIEVRDGHMAYADAHSHKQADAVGLHIEAQGIRLIDGMASMDQLAVLLGETTFEDREPTRPVKVHMSSTSLNAQNLRTTEDAAIPFELAAAFLPRGTLGIKGRLMLLPLSLEAEIMADQIGLAPLQGYVADRLNLTIARVDASALGQLHLSFPDTASPAKNSTPHISYAGMVRLINFATVDKTNATEFLRWKSLHLGKIDFQLPAPQAPMLVELGDIALSDFYARVIINANGRINLQDILVTPGTATEKSITTPTASPAGTVATTDSKTSPVQTAQVTVPIAKSPSTARPIIRVGRVTLANGSVNFTDNFIKPNYTANITRLAGSISSVASDKPAPADVVLRGAVDGDGTLEITGQVNALTEQLYLDIAANARDIELTRLTPYAAKYAGYAIEKGKLRMTVKYHIENGKLEARNNLFLDQLTFGERIEGPDATKLPVLFAVALLKNSRGEIDIDLPISGSLSDPQFSIGGIIVRLVVNLIVKAVTSPFTLIASAFGGGEELDHVAFGPGAATLDSASRARLDKIVAALIDRPALKLDITGRADAATDTEGARQLALKEQVRAQKIRKLLRKSREIDPGEVSVNADEYAEFLEDAYDAADFPKPRNLVGLQKSLPVEEMEKLMLANIQITDAELRRLAEARASAVLDYLTAEGRVARDRVFLVAPKLGSTDKDDKNSLSRVDFSLK